MKQIRNADDKLVCQIDLANKAVEIILKGFKTIVRFMADGRVEVVNTKPTR